MENYNITFGDYIKERRKEKGWSLRTMAQKLDISLTYLADVENGKRYAFPKETLLLLTNIFDISHNKKELNLFFDLAAETRNSLPLDVEEFMLINPSLVEFIRKLKNQDFISNDYITNLLQNINRNC